jgi:hypothetical protein
MPLQHYAFWNIIENVGPSCPLDFIQNIQNRQTQDAELCYNMQKRPDLFQTRVIDYTIVALSRNSPDDNKWKVAIPTSLLDEIIR